MSVLEGGGRAQSDGRRRRRWSAAEKQRIVAETFEPGASVSIVARRHDLNANMLFTWRREAKQTAVRMIEAPASFAAIEIAGEPSSAASAACVTAGRMEVAFPGGERVIVGADVDAAALARVIKVLRR
jgi:transposase-like protein